VSRRRQPWLGNGDGHVYEHVATPPEARTWGPLDCPSFVRVCHPENWPNDRDVPKALRRAKPKGNRKPRGAGLLQLALLVHRDRGE
jgi:hypothetical protein